MTPEILLIDDDVNASILRKRVMEFSEYRVQIALDALTGVALAIALRPALIMLDHSIPPMDGPEVFRRLRATVPQIAIVSYSGYEGLNAEYDPQPDAFLTKGTGVKDMLATIEGLIA